MFAKNLTALGKLCIILSSLLLVNCSSTKNAELNSESTFRSVEKDFNNTNHWTHTIYNAIKYNKNMLKKEDQVKQMQAVFFALNNAPEGEVVKWYNDKIQTFGLVKIVSSYPHGSGYCRILFTQISKKGKIRDFTETACKDVAYNGWQFIR